MTNFVLPGLSAEEVSSLQTIDIESNWKIFNGGVNAWILQTYLLLKEFGQEVSLSSDFSKTLVNIAHVTDLTNRPRPKDCFVVGVRADYPALRWCNFEIVQNKTQVSKNTACIGHWPQPGLIPASSRRQSVLKVGYFGREINHYTKVLHRASGFCRVRSEVQEVCNHLGLKLESRGPNEWNDYSGIDVSVGLRAFGRRRFNTKPATKMINAWLAGVPFIGGHDSAYEQHGVCGRDYLRVGTAEELRDAFKLLMEKRDVHDELVKNGLERSRMYSRLDISKQWVEVLATSIQSRFTDWQCTRNVD